MLEVIEPSLSELVFISYVGDVDEDTGMYHGQGCFCLIYMYSTLYLIFSIFLCVDSKESKQRTMMCICTNDNSRLERK